MSHMILQKIIETKECTLNVWGAFAGAKFIWIMQMSLSMSWVPDLYCPPEDPVDIP